MTRVVFYGGPYDGKECDLPFLPELLIGETMDGDFGRKTDTGYDFDFRVSTYVYHLGLPKDDSKPFVYKYRRERPDDIDAWIDEEP